MPARASLSRALLATILLPSAALAQREAPRQSFPLNVVDDLGSGVRLTADPAGLRSLMQRRQVVLEGVPLPGAPESEVTLKRLDLFTPDAVIAIDGAHHSPAEVLGDLTLWTGRVIGEPDSLAFFSFSSRGSRGFVRRAAGTTRMRAEPGPGRDWSDPLSIMESVLPGEAPGMVASCFTSLIDQPFSQPLDGSIPPTAKLTGPTTYECEIAIETDFQFYQLFNDEQAASDYATALLGAVSSFYLSEVDCFISLPYLGIHTTSGDGWSSPDNGDAGDVLTEFRAAWKDGQAPVSANLYHFLSGADLGGGVAYLNVLCSQSFGFGVSGNIEAATDLPVSKGFDTWDFVVVAHELGHNFATGHTHDYCPPIDECAPSGYFGACQTQQLCKSDGTVMSYCHICSGGMSNIDIRFHDTVATTIRSAIEQSCLQEATPTGALCLVTDDQVVATATYAGSDPDGVTVSFDNCGPASDLNWSAELMEVPSWVSLSAVSGTITDTASDLDLTFDISGVGTGEHLATLRISNDDDVTDFLDVPVLLTVDPRSFQVGDLLVGGLADAEDVDLAIFEGVKKMSFQVDCSADADVKLVLLDPSGDKVDSWKVSSGNPSQKSAKLEVDGTHTLKVVSQDGVSFGDFSIETSVNLPGSAEEKSKTVSPKKKKHNYADVKFRVMEGATIDATVVPNAKVEGTLSLQLFDDNGDSVDLTGLLSLDGLSFTGVTAGMTGKYKLRISGFTGKKKEAADVTITPTQPLGVDTVTID